MSRLRKEARITTGMAIVAIFAYLLVSLLFVMPQGVIKSAGKPITSLASPYFTQKWNVFAPNIAKSNPKLLMQAQWIDEDGERARTDWVNVTEVDFAALAGHPHPSRAHKTSYNLQTRFQGRYRNLNTDQRKIARNTFIKREGDGFAAKTTDELLEEFREYGKNNSQIRAYIREDAIMKEFASYFTSAYFDKEVIRVRWQISRDFPNTFEDRFLDETVREPTVITYGWRHVDDEIDPKRLEIFADYIDRKAGDR